MNSAGRGRVGIIGAGRLGQALARTAARAERDVVIANSRGSSTDSLGGATATGVERSIPWRRPQQPRVG